LVIKQALQGLSTTGGTIFLLKAFTGYQLKEALHEIIDEHTKLSYTPECWEALKRTDQDEDNPNNIIAFCTPKSILKADQDNRKEC